MATHFSPNEYFDQHYLADYEVFGSTAMCGFSLAGAMIASKRTRFRGLAEFVVCQFELNLLNQAFYTHAPHFGWREFSAPFADTHGCSMGHGMANHFPHSILRFAQQPSGGQVAPVSLTWEIVEAYTKFFLADYVSRFTQTNNPVGFSQEAFWKSIAGDCDCIACMLSASGWETKHVIGLL